MEAPAYRAGYGMRFLPNVWNYYSTIKTMEYYKTYWLKIRMPGFDLELSRHIV